MRKLFLLLLAGWMLCLCACASHTMPEYILDTEYFTLPLPSGVTCTILPDSDWYSIEFYENHDYETNGTGLLCTLKLYEEGEDCTLPGHVAYGTLETNNGNYLLTLLYPTEVTYTPSSASQHKELLDEIDFRLIHNLNPKEGCKWLVPQLEGPPVSDVVIEMQYYTVNLPTGWVGKYLYEIEEFADGTSILTFYEKESYETYGGIKLCSIHILTEDTEWSSVLNAILLGSLETPDGRFTVVASETLPHDVHAYAVPYDDMIPLTSTLYSTISPKDGCTLHHPGFSTDLPGDSFPSPEEAD